jgi:acyl-CoA synthetase (AMP-forming)/AMP-acid ligase II
MSAGITGIRQTISHIAGAVKAVKRLLETGILDVGNLAVTLETAKNARVYGPQAALAIQGGRKYPSLPAVVDEGGTFDLPAGRRPAHGENVFPQEVENLLVARADVSDAAVVGVEAPEFGKRLRAFIVPVPGAPQNPDEIKEYVKSNLARHKVPRDVVFIDELPRNATGKLLRRALVELDVDR